LSPPEYEPEADQNFADGLEKLVYSKYGFGSPAGENLFESNDTQSKKDTDSSDEK
jgi:hypothetical protein